MKQLNIFCVSHNPLNLPSLPHFHLIQVGKMSEDLGVFRDNNKDNIADKNPYYSELTAFYYVWKNLQSSAVGFCHYRRYLIPPILHSWLRNNQFKPYGSGFLLPQNSFFEALNHLQSAYVNSFEQILENTDIILPHSNPLPQGGFISQYANFHPIYPLFRVLAILAEMDQKMGMLAHQFFLHSRQAYWNNLLITHWRIFDQYCQFLFEVLLRLELEIELPESAHQKRVFAFLSERLLNFWIWYNKLKVTTVDWGILENYTQTREPHQWNGNTL